MNDRKLAWIFLGIFIIDLFAMVFTMCMADVPTVIQWLLIFIYVLILIGTIVLVYHHNHK